MKDIAIYGAGGLGREIACLLRHLTESAGQNWNLIGFFDDGVPAGTPVSHFGYVLGGIREVNEWPTELNLVLCFGSPNTLRKISGLIRNPAIIFPNIIAANFKIGDPETFKIGMGNIIQRNCAVTSDCTIGDFNLFNGGVILGHDVTVGNCNVFMPGTRIAGEVNIGNECQFGAMSFVRQCLTVPDRVILSPLSPLLTRPRPDSLYMGNPAKLVKL